MWRTEPVLKCSFVPSGICSGLFSPKGILPWPVGFSTEEWEQTFANVYEEESER